MCPEEAERVAVGIEAGTAIRINGGFFGNNTAGQIGNFGSNNLSVSETGGYVSHAEAVATGTTDASGDLTVTHGMVATPTIVKPIATGTGFQQAQPHTIGATTFKIRFLDAAGAALATTAATAHWRARYLP